MANKKKIIPFAILKGLRAERGMSQADVAKIVGISEGSYLHKENGKRDFTSTEMRIIKRFFKVSLDALFIE